MAAGETPGHTAQAIVADSHNESALPRSIRRHAVLVTYPWRQENERYHYRVEA
jgi:hypothetical protein